MKIGIMSDTHDRLEHVKKTIKLFQREQVELIIHCGDWVSPFVPQYIYSLSPRLEIPIESVFGNNEGDHFRFFERQKKEKWNIKFHKETFVLEVDGKIIMVYHGSNKQITEAFIVCKKYDVVLTGHTHKTVNETINGVLHVNPGSVSGYSEGHIANTGTVAIYETKTNEVRILPL